MPLERDPARGNELFLRLPPPHSNIIITPPRQEDVEVAMENMNDMNVVRWLAGPPYPYTKEDSEGWVAKITPECAEAETLYEQLINGRHSKSLNGSPVRTIREVDPVTGDQKYLGDIGIQRATYLEVVNKEQREKLTTLNASLEPGDPAIVWEFGDQLASSHHGRGIMSAAIKAIMNDVAIPLLNAHQVVASYFANNQGSKRVFEKNGFVYVETFPDAFTIPEIKGGGTTSIGLLRWERPRGNW